MPTRQPTPGPSTLSASAVLQPLNTKKRAVSELSPDDDLRQHTKKPKKDLEHPDASQTVHTNHKENKKKRRRRKKKSPLTAPDTDHERTLQSQPKPKGLTAPPDAPTSVPPPQLIAKAQSAPTEPIRNSVSNAHSELLVTKRNEGSALSSSDKGKARATSEPADHSISQLDAPNLSLAPPQEADSMTEAHAKIAELSAQLEFQKKLLSRHADNLSNLQQSLTCEICLDLLHKPFALSPCGHVACYMCLVRWFTSVQIDVNPNGNLISQPEDVPRLLASQPAVRGVYLRKRKTCPLCRAAVTERPAEIWSIKSMVANLIKSRLADLPSQPPIVETQNNDDAVAPANGRTNNDPWRNIFRKAGRGGFHMHFPPPEGNEGGGGPEDVGMWDAEDGVHRCVDCMHEIWGGLCTSCNREYPGHARFDGDDDSDGGSDGGPGEHFLRRRLRQIWDGYARNNQHMGWDDEEDGQMDLLWEAYASEGDLSDDSVDDDDDFSESGLEGDGAGFESAVDTLGEGSWDSSDDDSDGDNDLLMHHREMIHMHNNIPDWPFHQRFPQREGGGVAHIEEVAGAAEEEEEGSQSDAHSQLGDGDRYEQDSFIDDEEEVEEVEVHHYPGRNFNRGDHPRLLAVPELSGSDSESAPEDDDGLAGYRAAARSLGRGTRLGGRPRGSIIIESDDNSDDENVGLVDGYADTLTGEEDEEEDVREAGRRVGGRRRYYVDGSSDEE